MEASRPQHRILSAERLESSNHLASAPPRSRRSAPYPSWASHYFCARRDVARDYAARANDRMIANGHAREDDRATANPYVLSNADRSPELQPRLPLLGVIRMIGGIDLHSRPNCGPIADRHLCHVEDDAVEVHIGVGSDTDVEAVIAVKGRTDNRSRPNLA